MMTIFALLLATAFASQEIVSSINNAQSTWEAIYDPENIDVQKLTTDEFRMMLGVFHSNERLPEVVASSDAVNAPASFDSRTAFRGKLVPVLNQGGCGSCWAFAMTTVAADRAMIRGEKPSGFALSPQWTVNCDFSNKGCNGGNPSRAWTYAHNQGIPPASCLAYTSGTSGRAGACPAKCTDGSTPVKYKPNVAKFTSSAQVMMEEISKNGPIEVCLSVYEDFRYYKSGVYKHTTGRLLGGHAVTAVGYGTDNGTPYWIIQNSWGPSWGESGYFRILRGSNECGIESQCTSYP